MRRGNVTAYVLVGLGTAGAIGVGSVVRMSYAAVGVLLAVVAVMVLSIYERSSVDEQAGVAASGAENAVLIVMTLLLGVSVVSVLVTGVFRILEGAALRGASWLALGCLLAGVGIKFLHDHWSR
ncbi:hypothetical protein GCM10009767_15700 [Kocuria aegyptia]|uniref:DUF2178 domain-containing protein n=2 Tax=Kocuria aegyptia TaxID=330943 RepID=A0ABP4WMI0_9MICC